MKEITFFVPSEAEQMAIVDFVTRETTGISVAISQLEREIELLREYRTRLVADVVTGKLDVREAAAQLPDEVLPDTNADAADPGDDLEIADEEATA
jgi:type I restriction enzyme S subunit